MIGAIVFFGVSFLATILFVLLKAWEYTNNYTTPLTRFFRTHSVSAETQYVLVKALIKKKTRRYMRIVWLTLLSALDIVLSYGRGIVIRIATKAIHVARNTRPLVKHAHGATHLQQMREQKVANGKKKLLIE